MTFTVTNRLTLHDMILDALDYFSTKGITPSWQDIKFEIHNQYGVWVKETTLVRKLRKMAENGAVRRDERGHFWK